MASNRHAPEVSYSPYHHEVDDRGHRYGNGYGTYETQAFSPVGLAEYADPHAGPGAGEPGDAQAFAEAHAFTPAEPHETYETQAFAPVEAYGPEPEADGWDEWNPTEESIRPVRGKHRVAKQRGGMARSGAVLGVGVIAAVGAGGMATAKDKPSAPVSMPDLASMAGAVTDEIPAAKNLPGIGSLVDDDAGSDPAAHAPLSQAALNGSGTDSESGQTDPGEALRERILAQAAQQQSEADRTAREDAAAAAAKQAAEEAAKKADAEAKKKAEAKRKAAEEAKKKAEAERLAKLARSYTLPTSNFQLTSGYGQAGGMWENDHTGQDFAAPTGTPVNAVHTGTVKEAGWAGSYGYRIVLELNDGTEVWYCHLSSMQVSAGEEVNTKDVIGNVGSTGNSTGPHLHLEVRPGGGDAIDPLSWLRGKGLSV
ncbi:M23 family peptidase [Streptomyces armeniacus]|uniref:M23 family peptidase n=1 Tax=Streptomyces armeniacus TaxID=83291 RepID=A0A345XTW5_9ACTN|nr:M23 family metallopeptidase [Streptomyces armeniacus]AXK35081.1 M23 family peptidase [Streptomyces armeniacus]